MLRWTALASILALCAIVDAAFCDEIGSTHSLPATKRLARFEIVMGRITISHACCGQCRSEQAGDLASGEGEFLSVNARGKAVSLRYESVTAERRLTVDFPSADELEIVAQYAGDEACTVRFSQKPRGRLQLAIDRGGAATELSAPGFWQLMLAYPAECNEYLTPLLETLRPDWRLEESAERIERKLLHAPHTLHAEQRERIDDLVEQLDANDFTLRQEAFRQLLATGQPALAHLRRIAPQSITAEQRFRVRQLIDALAVDREDTPERAALWLAELPSVWIALMSHSDGAVRQRAAEHLARICGDEFEFDATAARERRESQLADVRQQFESE